MTNEVLASVRQWLAKADSDWDAVEVLTASERCPAAAACFHCQQYVEKLLKALLTVNEIEAPRTHDLRRLSELALGVAPELAGLMKDASALTLHAVQSRYPGDFEIVSSAEMQEMLAIVDRFAAVLLPLLKDYWPTQEP